MPLLLVNLAKLSKIAWPILLGHDRQGPLLFHESRPLAAIRWKLGIVSVCSLCVKGAFCQNLKISGKHTDTAGSAVSAKPLLTILELLGHAG